MQLESATVNGGKEVPAQPRNQNSERAQTTSKEGDQKGSPVMQAKFEQPAIATTESFESSLKTFLKTD